ncbi:MAG: AmmeMemoRadiSam system radical SAM enzyme [Thermoanaerobaculaceae bacterium]|nr:AmmeMemoRadiSam system radical SAM enzyme [Thermoanaerobaculaceae bacterium]MDI9622199.1 AmmeMemoRadiSam system radical SAM enzyme [Acidobacteriota bacterium]NLH12608.1 AmmeMemoRadiSam system radical SAM enzyme [Holophagae bacterium]HPW54922.1 AmmeMemoRadiSam system radical SAM enzyme [Thermoanaerobaculaceae bacterium]
MSGDLDRRRLLSLACAGAGFGLLARGLESEPVVGATVAGDQIPAREASWYRKLEEKRVACQLCPRACQVAEAETGGCGVRENRGGVYHTLVWGAACAVHVDPIEKKPFFHVLPGQRALSFATAGCNVECKFCQNWEISQFRAEQVKAVYLPPEELAKAARRAGAPLLSATYSEPVVFWEYVRDAAQAGRRLGIRSTVVSNGYIQEQPLREVLPLLAAFKVDLKAFREQFYRDLVRGELKPVLRALEIIRASGVWLEIVVLLIPTLNDSEAEVRDLARWVVRTLGPEVPVHFTRFHPTYRLTNLRATPVATLDRAWAIAKAEGLQFAYVGNVPGHAGESTVCPGCGELLIERAGFQVLSNRLHHGACPACHRTIPGVWV